MTAAYGLRGHGSQGIGSLRLCILSHGRAGIAGGHKGGGGDRIPRRVCQVQPMGIDQQNHF